MKSTTARPLAVVTAVLLVSALAGCAPDPISFKELDRTGDVSASCAKAFGTPEQVGKHLGLDLVASTEVKECAYKTSDDGSEVVLRVTTEKPTTESPFIISGSAGAYYVGLIATSDTTGGTLLTDAARPKAQKWLDELAKAVTA
ncbi:hypothetical protein [Pengzhenrongella sp.]|uniref:hypothetical protein n=1 Tax=Pengzhenrongella sp. TaxID=2888820 RepID=UPI002F94CAAF